MTLPYKANPITRQKLQSLEQWTTVWEAAKVCEVSHENMYQWVRRMAADGLVEQSKQRAPSDVFGKYAYQYRRTALGTEALEARISADWARVLNRKMKPRVEKPVERTPRTTRITTYDNGCGWVYNGMVYGEPNALALPE